MCLEECTLREGRDGAELLTQNLGQTGAEPELQCPGSLHAATLPLLVIGLCSFKVTLCAFLRHALSEKPPLGIRRVCAVQHRGQLIHKSESHTTPWT